VQSLALKRAPRHSETALWNGGKSAVLPDTSDRALAFWLVFSGPGHLDTKRRTPVYVVRTPEFRWPVAQLVWRHFLCFQYDS